MGVATPIEHPKNQLTPRERDVMDWIATNRRVHQISDSMGISINTVKFHMKNIYAKLGAETRREALQRYERQLSLACRLD